VRQALPLLHDLHQERVYLEPAVFLDLRVCLLDFLLLLALSYLVDLDSEYL